MLCQSLENDLHAEGIVSHDQNSPLNVVVSIDLIRQQISLESVGETPVIKTTKVIKCKYHISFYECICQMDEMESVKAVCTYNTRF